jgi:hypothetical protein
VLVSAWAGHPGSRGTGGRAPLERFWAVLPSRSAPGHRTDSPRRTRPPRADQFLVTALAGVVGPPCRLCRYLSALLILRNSSSVKVTPRGVPPAVGVWRGVGGGIGRRQGRPQPQRLPCRFTASSSRNRADSRAPRFTRADAGPSASADSARRRRARVTASMLAFSPSSPPRPVQQQTAVRQARRQSASVDGGIEPGRLPEKVGRLLVGPRGLLIAPHVREQQRLLVEDVREEGPALNRVGEGEPACERNGSLGVIPCLRAPVQLAQSRGPVPESLRQGD